MKQLILVRHAKSNRDDPSLADFERPLSKRGKRDALLVGQRLRERGLVIDLILTSSAKRTRQTAKRLAVELDYPEAEIRRDGRLYLQGVVGLLTVLQRLDDVWQNVLLVGHNPDLSELARQLSGQALEDLPTSGAFGLQLSIDHWSALAADSGRIEFVL